jgi:hypothetical protein
MDMVAVTISLFSLGLSIVTFVMCATFITQQKTGATITEILKKPIETPNQINIKEEVETTELENFTPNFTKPINIKYL